MLFFLVVQGFSKLSSIPLSAIVTEHFEVVSPLGDKYWPLFFNLLYLLYTSTEVFLQATPAKLLFKMKILTSAAGQPTKNMLALRWFVKHTGNIFAIVYLLTDIEAINIIQLGTGLIVCLGCLLALNESKRTLHDLISGTAVFRV